MPYGYQSGQPFGDPNGFTRSTQASEVDRFNQWLRAQPWWQAIKGAAPGFNDHQKTQLVQALRQRGINVPSALHIDDAGNLNQSRTPGDWGKLALKGAAIGGAAMTGLGAAGIGPMAGLFGSSAAAEEGASAAAPALEGGGTLAANLGAASALPSYAAAAGLPALEGGGTLAANLGADSALPTAGGASAALGSDVGASSALPTLPSRGLSGIDVPGSYGGLPPSGVGSQPSYLAASSGGPGLAGKALNYGVPVVGSFLSSWFGNRAANNRQQQQVALAESSMDPFRHQIDQAGDLASLDQLERSSYTPATYGMPSAATGYKPTRTGGYSYTKSPELVDAAAALKNDVLAGHTAPTMTDSNNYGKTAVLNLAASRAARRRPPAPPAVPQTSPYGSADPLRPSYYGT